MKLHGCWLLCLWTTKTFSNFLLNWNTHLWATAILLSVQNGEEERGLEKKKNTEKYSQNFADLYLGKGLMDLIQIWNVASLLLLAAAEISMSAFRFGLPCWVFFAVLMPELLYQTVVLWLGPGVVGLWLVIVGKYAVTKNCLQFFSNHSCASSCAVKVLQHSRAANYREGKTIWFIISIIGFSNFCFW